MKVYCLYDSTRRKYFRSIFDGRDCFTTKPYQLCADRKRLEDRATRLNKKVEWERAHTGPVPKLVVKEFEMDTEQSHARH